ncbi:MAG: LamG domain-containing protein [Bacteroidota bacterium]
MNIVALLVALVAGLSQTQTQVNLDDGLVAYYPFDGSARDKSGYLRDGTTYGYSSYVEGPWEEQNTAINFNGENTHVLLPSNGIDLGDNAYSFGFYFSLNNITKMQQTFLNTDPHTGISLGFNRQGNHRIYIFIGNCDIAGWVFSFSQYGAKNSFKANEWYHLTFTKQAGLYTIYVDGQLDLETSLTSPPSINCQPKFLLGDIQCCSSPEYLDGKMSDVVFYKDRALLPHYIVTRLMVKNLFASPTIMPSASPTHLPTLSPTRSLTSAPTKSNALIIIVPVISVVIVICCVGGGVVLYKNLPKKTVEENISRHKQAAAFTVIEENENISAVKFQKEKFDKRKNKLQDKVVDVLELAPTHKNTIQVSFQNRGSLSSPSLSKQSDSSDLYKENLDNEEKKGLFKPTPDLIKSIK